MNKSKFLKKSLAMLLVLMLVVAMIQLSASAAVPVLWEASANEILTVDNTEVWYYDVTTQADTLDRSSNNTEPTSTKLVLWDMDQDLPQLGYSFVSKDDAIIAVTMPHTSEAAPKYVVDELVLPEDATTTYTFADGTTQQNVTIKTDAESGTATQVENGATITVSNGGFRTNYTLKITSL